MPTKRRGSAHAGAVAAGAAHPGWFPAPLAARVARDERYDLHELTALVESGCAPALAVRIVKPIELRAEVPDGTPARSRQRPPQE